MFYDYRPLYNMIIYIYIYIYVYIIYISVILYIDIYIYQILLAIGYEPIASLMLWDSLDFLQDIMGYSKQLMIPSGNQTWVAGKSPN